MNQLLYIIDFQTMPRGFGLVLNRLRGVVGVIWLPVEASGKRCVVTRFSHIFQAS